MAGLRNISLLVLVGVCIGYSSAALPLPKYITACSKSDPKLNECALKEGLKAIPFVVKGDKEYKIPVLDPLEIVEIKVEGGLTFTAKDVKIYGLKDATLKAVDIDLKKKHGVVKAYSDLFEINGDYDVNGKILILPIKGQGKANITLIKTDLVYDTDFELYKKDDGKEYIKFTTHKLDFECNDMKIHLDNLFNGDKALGDNMNVFLNENWRDVKKDLGPSIAEALALVITDILNKIAHDVPYDAVFLS